MTQADRPRIAITMGDPAGVGPELCLRALAEPSIQSCCLPVVFGDVGVLARVAEACQLAVPSHVFSEGGAWSACDEPCILDLGVIDAATVTPGTVDAHTGRAAYAYIQSAIREAWAGRIDAICTAPIHKEALQMAGVAYPGHTEIFADQTGAESTCMMLTSNEITCSLVTTHVGYGDVTAGLSVERVGEVIELTAEAMRLIRGREPRLVVCGLNPHAGEHGLFGNGEEETIITPAIATARENGLQIEGPLPPDTAFIERIRSETDAYICMYHDQGLIPLKMLAFDSAVNVTLGLPIVRTSVDHGTALDIAWQGVATSESLFEAIRLAAQLVE